MLEEGSVVLAGNDDLTNNRTARLRGNLFGKVPTRPALAGLFLARSPGLHRSQCPISLALADIAPASAKVRLWL